MEVGDVVLHLGGGVDEAFHLAGGDLENFVFAVQLLVAVGDERVGILHGVELAEGGIDEEGVGNEGTFHEDFLSLDGRVGGSHGAIDAESGFLQG